VDEDDGSTSAHDEMATPWRPLTTEPREATATYAEIRSIGDTPGGLYATYGAVTANAIAIAAAGKEPRRKAYMRRIVLIALIIGIGGSALVVAIALLVN